MKNQDGEYKTTIATKQVNTSVIPNKEINVYQKNEPTLNALPIRDSIRRSLPLPLYRFQFIAQETVMKHLRTVSLVIATAVFSHNAVAQIHPDVTKVVPKSITYDISAERVGSGDIIEFTPMTIKWTLTVTRSGIAGPDPAPTKISICPVINSPDSQFQCAQIGIAIPGRTYHGTMTVPAPPAGKQSPLRIVVLQPVKNTLEDWGQTMAVAETKVRVDSAARYDVAIASFEVLTTRSTSTDTVWLTLQGLIKSDPKHASDSPDACGLAGFNWCVFNQKYGDVHDSGVRIVENFRVGPYDLVPEREQDLRILFYLDNHGDNVSQEIGAGVANGFSKAGMIILSAYGAESGGSSNSSFASGLDDAMEKLHSAEFASCDGKLASDVVVIANTTIANQSQNTLDAFTRANGMFTSPVLNNGVPKIYNEIDGDFRCDRRGGKYTVTYAIYRTSWRDWGFQPRW